MGPELKSKFIQHLIRQKSDEGFTLVELLTVIFIIGILASIAISNLLNQNVKAKQTEAKQNVALVNKSQNSYRAEHRDFASSFNLLAIGTITDNIAPGEGTTTNYLYKIPSSSSEATTITASPTDNNLRGFSGGATRFTNTVQQIVIGTVLCEMTSPGVPATPPTAIGGNTGTGSAPTCDVTVHNKLSL
jgi:type IV pilus assembly protein PilA